MTPVTSRLRPSRKRGPGTIRHVPWLLSLALALMAACSDGKPADEAASVEEGDDTDTLDAGTSRGAESENQTGDSNGEEQQPEAASTDAGNSVDDEPEDASPPEETDDVDPEPPTPEPDVDDALLDRACARIEDCGDEATATETCSEFETVASLAPGCSPILDELLERLTELPSCDATECDPLTDELSECASDVEADPEPPDEEPPTFEQELIEASCANLAVCYGQSLDECIAARSERWSAAHEECRVILDGYHECEVEAPECGDCDLVLEEFDLCALETMPVCTPGAIQCESNARLRVCSEEGQWEFDRSCSGGCTDEGDCFECTPGTSWCQGPPAEVVTCSPSGISEVTETCPMGCVVTTPATPDDVLTGQCVAGECAPGEWRCDADELQRCSTEGEWVRDRFCFDGCVDAACVEAAACDELRGCCSQLPASPARDSCNLVAENGGATGCQSTLDSLIEQGECN